VIKIAEIDIKGAIILKGKYKRDEEGHGRYKKAK
jgi:hypothetical protein